MTQQFQSGLSEQIRLSAEGNPIYLFFDPKSEVPRYVVRLPDGRYMYCDPQGGLLKREADKIQPVPAAVLGGMLGAFLGGPVGALIGGTVLFALAALGEKNSAP